MSASHMSRVVQGWGASQSCAYCHGFAKIPPLIRGSDGVMYANPDFDMVRILIYNIDEVMEDIGARYRIMTA